MPDHHPIHDKLKGTPPFKAFTDAELDEFLRITDPVNCQRGDFVVRQGETGDCMFYLAEGTCRVMTRREGQSAELAVLSPGALFGELALFAHRPRFADVIALTDCVLVKVSEPMVHAFAGLYPAAVYKLLAGIIREIGERLCKTSNCVLDSLLPAVPPPKS